MSAPAGMRLALIFTLGGIGACEADKQIARLVIDVEPCLDALAAQPCGGAGATAFEAGGKACLVIQGPGGDLGTLTFEFDEEAGALRRTAGGFPGALKPGDSVNLELLLLRPGAAECPEISGVGRCRDHDSCAASLGVDSFAVRGDGVVQWTYSEGRTCAIECHTDCVVEVCSGRDDDCDGATDEGFAVGAACSAPGVCGSGLNECGPEGGVICDVAPGGTRHTAVAELCDGLDNDCDGVIDNGIDLAGACDGACGGGTFECNAEGGLRCSTDPGGDDHVPVEEACSGQDDDCDGATDEGFDDLGQPCDGPDDDECALGTWVCNEAGDARVCVGDDAALEEICGDEIDNDCDGFVNEGCCEDSPDFTDCEDGQDPRFLDLCMGGICVSPGCGDLSCNTGGPWWGVADSGRDLTVVGENGDTPVLVDLELGLTWRHALGADQRWADAIAECESSTYGGHLDWRVPDPYEALTLVDFTQGSPAISADLISGMPANQRIWTSSASRDGKSWVIKSKDGKLERKARGDSHRVLCVRGRPQVPQSPRFFAGAVPCEIVGEQAAARQIEDQWTGLLWQGISRQAAATWADADTYCADLVWGCADDWRLGEVLELSSLLDDRVADGAAINEIFSSWVDARHWSATQSHDGKHWVVGFDGATSVEIKANNEDHEVRCVRDAPDE